MPRPRVTFMSGTWNEDADEPEVHPAMAVLREFGLTNAGVTAAAFKIGEMVHYGVEVDEALARRVVETEIASATRYRGRKKLDVYPGWRDGLLHAGWRQGEDRDDYELGEQDRDADAGGDSGRGGGLL